MATPNSLPSSTLRSTDTSSAVRRRPKERPKGSLQIYSRPRLYGLPSPPYALRTRYPLKGKPRGKGAEGVLSRQRGVDDETKQVLKRCEDLRHGLHEDSQDILDLYGDLAEGV
ncbi:hypothetical protein DENSPDRAFT_533774 [Dentipellis sp. KUC8613]|nr:hypothetical protein DENSPDRAFT_533774 [Dentipellis sp. KUC8613]